MFFYIKTKEIGIRKVLGAGYIEVIISIMKGFLILVSISFLVSVPLGYFLSKEWLQSFAYRIEPSPFIFMLSGLFSLLVAGFTIFSQSLNAAKSDPVKTLRHE